MDCNKKNNNGDIKMELLNDNNYKVERKEKHYFTLCSCFHGDLKTCLYGFCCTPCLNTSTTYKISTGKRYDCGNCWCIPFNYTPFYNRKVINRHYHNETTNCNDCLVSVFCTPCVVIQNENNYNQLISLN